MKKYTYLFAGLAVLLTLLFVTEIDSFARVKQATDNSDAIPVGKSFAKQTNSETSLALVKNSIQYDDAIPYKKRFETTLKIVKPVPQSSTYRLFEVAYRKITDLFRNYIDDPSVNPNKVIIAE